MYDYSCFKPRLKSLLLKLYPVFFFSPVLTMPLPWDQVELKGLRRRCSCFRFGQTVRFRRAHCTSAKSRSGAWQRGKMGFCGSVPFVVLCQKKIHIWTTKIHEKEYFELQRPIQRTTFWATNTYKQHFELHHFWGESWSTSFFFPPAWNPICAGTQLLPRGWHAHHRRLAWGLHGCLWRRLGWKHLGGTFGRIFSDDLFSWILLDDFETDDFGEFKGFFPESWGFDLTADALFYVLILWGTCGRLCNQQIRFLVFHFYQGVFGLHFQNFAASKRILQCSALKSWTISVIRLR